MADESGSSGGTRKRRRKSGVRKSRDYYINPGPRQDSRYTQTSPSIGNYLQSILSGGANAISGFTTPSESGALQNLLKQGSKKFGGDEPSGGYKMNKVAPQATMLPKPPPPKSPGQSINDAAAQGYADDGYSATQQLVDFATGLLSQSGPTFDYESAMQQAAQGIRQAYGAEIAALRQNNRVARKSTKRARKEIEHLYKGLAKQYGKQEARADRRGQKSADRQMGYAEDANTILTDLNNSMIADETTMLQELGQQQAAGELISPDYDRMGEQVATNTNQGLRAATQAERMGQNNARWFDRSQGAARLEGTNRSADMLSNLLPYMFENRNAIAGLKGQRAQDIAASRADIQSQAAQASADEREFTWNGVMDLLGQVQDIEQANIDNRQSAQEWRWKKKQDRYDNKVDRYKARTSRMKQLQREAPDAMENYAPGIKDALSIIAQTKDPGDQVATNALMQLFSSNAWRTGTVSLPNGETTKLTPFEAQARARKIGIRMGLKGRQLQEFINAAAASVG